MATEHGRATHATAAHLRNGWRLARVGLWVGLFGIAAEAVGMLFGTPPDWRMKLTMLPLWTGAAFVGGTLYSLFLPDSARRDPGPAARARVRTGALAGAVTGALGAVALMVAAPAAVPLPIMAFVELLLVACTAG
ncbi:MAG TPA: hypothetical protein VFR81_22740, partial [Longimicrobium sp.]|nr:hypothetical protein [Longimicrobium sp.]